ncbi:MAG TPA: polysaccharide biosynthesis C-terminal domain-containing protein [Pyrinomonadaceae bacterium]|nr:polysaccharide biosynthesis C-terminal domain-containing protein [Pyrinomonadaceae bacterium]
MFTRNIRMVFSTNALGLLCGVLTSLLSAWALGPAGRGDLLIVMLWPPVCALLATCGLTQAHRYWAAKDPDSLSMLFSNALLFSAVAGAVTLAIAQVVIPHLVGHRSAETMRLVHIYLLNIPAALVQFLMIGLLEGARRFGWAGSSRLITFAVQAALYLVLWLLHDLTVATAAFSAMAGQFAAMFLALFAVWSQLKPRWKPSWLQWRRAVNYGLRGYPGTVADFATLRMDQLLLGGLASSAAIGLYFVAVRLSEITAILAGSVADAVMPEVAAAKHGERADQLLAKSLRLTIYVHLLVLVPLWIAAPYILRFVYGESFAAAGTTFRILLLASVVLTAGGIAISGLNGFGHPGLSTVARVCSAAVTVVALLTLLPRFGIAGAAMASLLGYGVMMVVALTALMRRRERSLWSYLKPRASDLAVPQLRSLFRTELPAVQNLDA